MPYEQTSVSVESSQGAVRKLLTKYGAQRFTFSEGAGEDGRTWVMLEFVYAPEYDRPHLIRLLVPCKPPDEGSIKRKAQRARTRTAADIKAEAMEQEMRRIWRVIFHNLKARMESVAEEVESFEQAWLPHIVDPATGMTLWQRVEPAVTAGRLVIGGPGLALPSGKEP